jgi:hypothetical protein
VSRKRKLLVAVVVAIPVVLLVALAKPVREEWTWQLASYRDSESSYRDYVRDWPDGRHTDEAQRRYDDATWQETSEQNTEQGFRDYLSTHPEGRHADEAERGIDDLHWEEARRFGTPESLGEYLVQHRDGAHAEEASQRIELLGWEAARESEDVVRLAAFLEAYPSSAYADEARVLLDEVRWRDVLAANTVRAYVGYLRLPGAGRFDAQARRRISLVRRSDEPFRAALREGTRAALVTFLTDFPGHRRTAEARATIRDLAGVDIFTLLAQGRIEARVEGVDITRVEVEVRRRVPRPVTVKIPPGTFFVARGSFQNMVATQPEEVTLSDGKWTSVSVSAACANRTRAIPRPGNGFAIERSPYQAELVRLIPRLREEEYDVQQAAIWIITDNATHADLGTLTFVGGGRVIGYDDTARAMMIVDRAGIDITSKAIWRDRADVRASSGDAEFRRWLARRERA